MIDEMRARFGPRFLETARGRIRRSLELLGKPKETAALITELHSLAGEAAMLGLETLSDTARNGENHAKEWDKGSTTAKLYCARSVRSLSQQIEEFAASIEPGAGSNSRPPTATATATTTTAAAATATTTKATTTKATTTKATGQAPSPSRPGTRSRILIIDDSRLAGDHLCDALNNSELDSRLALTQDAAIDEVRRFAPALVVCDVHMPGVDLGELCTALREEATRPIVIVLLSGMSEPELARHAKEVAADSYVSKHAGIERVVSHIKTAVEGLTT